MLLQGRGFPRRKTSPPIDAGKGQPGSSRSWIEILTVGRGSGPGDLASSPNKIHSHRMDLTVRCTSPPPPLLYVKNPSSLSLSLPPRPLRYPLLCPSAPPSPSSLRPSHESHCAFSRWPLSCVVGTTLLWLHSSRHPRASRLRPTRSMGRGSLPRPWRSIALHPPCPLPLTPPSSDPYPPLSFPPSSIITNLARSIHMPLLV